MAVIHVAELEIFEISLSFIFSINFLSCKINTIPFKTEMYLLFPVLPRKIFYRLQIVVLVLEMKMSLSMDFEDLSLIS